MLKENWRFISRLERAGDFIIVFVAFITAYYGRAAFFFWNNRFRWGLPFGGEQLAPLSDYLVVLLVALVGVQVLLQAFGAYSSMRLRSPGALLGMFASVALLVFVLLAATLFLLKLDLSRSYIALFCLLLVLFLAAERYLVLGLLRFWRRRGFNFRTIMICGVGEQALKLAKEIYQRPELGIFVRCFADLRNLDEIPPAELALFRGQLRKLSGKSAGRIVCGVAPLAQMLKEYAIDEVIFTHVSEVMPQVEEMVLLCAEQGVRTTLVADLFSIGMVRSGLSYFGDLPLIHFQTPPGDRWDLAVKRIMDLVCSALLMVLLAPLFILVALSIWVTTGRPIFFVQKRVGLNGHLFDLYKFRSMYQNAEQELERLKAHNEMQGPAFKIKEDPRVTKLGHLLRRFSLDELPQLWNVFIGDMSLVGPRPPVPGEVTAYERCYRRRLSMRPGITCTWQVSGRNEIHDFADWVKLDLEYIDNWSLGRDIKLLLKTVPAVLLGTGAR